MCRISRRLTLRLFFSDLHKHFALLSRGRQQDSWPNHRTVESVRTTTSELSSGNHDETYATLNYRHTGKCGTLLVNNRELKEPRRRRQQKPHKFAYLTMKNSLLHALHVHFSSFDILKTFSFFLRREMTCFPAVWTTWSYDDTCSILSSYVPSAGSKLIPGQLEDIFQA